uniref:Uncharacterized protein n=1 Tax=Plectus sambesii TaxID=2011161 RepID=A0A914UYR5_9BILA
MLASFQNWRNSLRESNNGTPAPIHAPPHRRPSSHHRRSSSNHHRRRAGPRRASLPQTASVATAEQTRQREVRLQEYFHSSSPTAIYEDKFVRVTASILRIKRYWFPLRTSRDIELDTIRAVFWRTITEKDDCCLMAPWMLSCTQGALTWWACDSAREWGAVGSCTVRVEVGEASLKGFSVENLNKFLIALEAALSPRIPVLEDL